MTPLKREQKHNIFAYVFPFVFRYWTQHLLLVGMIILGVCLSTGAEVYMPVVSGHLITQIAAPEGASVQGIHKVISWVGWIAGLGIAIVIGKRMAYWSMSVMTPRIMGAMTMEGFARIQRFSVDWHANNFAGSTVRRLTRGTWALDTLNDTVLLLLLPDIVVLMGTVAVFSWRWPLMGAVLGVIMAVFVMVSCLLTLNYVAPQAQKANMLDTEIGGALADAVTCNSVVKAFGAEQREESRLKAIMHRWHVQIVKTWIRGTNSANLQNIYLLGMRLALIGFVVWMWAKGQAGPGDVAYILTMLFVVQGYLRDVGQQVSAMQRAVNEMEELVTFFQLPLETTLSPSSLSQTGRDSAQAFVIQKGDIAFKNVTFHYGAYGTPLFSNLNVHIKAGSRVALVGPSGSGKSTLIKLIQRQYDVQAGGIFIDGVNIATLSPSLLRTQIALVPQEPILFHRSLAENIAYAKPHASREEIIQAATLANAHEFIERLPAAYDTLVGERGIKLSGGERQRIAIARAFLADTRILILDEATSSLDSEAELMVQQAMKRLMQGRTVIVIAHRLSTIVEMERIIVFSHGKVKEEGTHEALLKITGGLYRRLFELQYGETTPGADDPPFRDRV